MFFLTKSIVRKLRYCRNNKFLCYMRSMAARHQTSLSLEPLQVAWYPVLLDLRNQFVSLATGNLIFPLQLCLLRVLATPLISFNICFHIFSLLENSTSIWFRTYSSYCSTYIKYIMLLASVCDSVRVIVIRTKESSLWGLADYTLQLCQISTSIHPSFQLHIYNIKYEVWKYNRLVVYTSITILGHLYGLFWWSITEVNWCEKLK